MDGILLVDKPEGVTSAGVIRALRSRFGRRKVGHLGTLDPFASGLLPLCIGEATKIARYLLVEQKEYEGAIRLGVATDTLDPTGIVTDRAPVPPIGPQELGAVARRFSGRIWQTPPMFSAIKRAGVPLYRLARKGVEVERQPRELSIAALELTLASPECLEFRVECSKGTYVRVLAADIGAALGTVAHLERLRRTAVGRFRAADAHEVEALRAGEGPLPVIPIGAALADMARFRLPSSALAMLRRGQQRPLEALPAGVAGETALVLGEAEEVGGLIEMGPAGRWRLVRLLRAASVPLHGENHMLNPDGITKNNENARRTE